MAADFTQAAALAHRALLIRSKPKNLNDAYQIARAAVLGAQDRYRTFKAAYVLLGMPRELWSRILSRWKAAGGPPLAVHAPYTAYCLLVDTFFVAVAKKLIAPERLSNRTDIAYLYYLPFTMIFASNDNLHRRTVPLFLREDQLFVAGNELKCDLQVLDAHFSALPADQLEQGLFRFAAGPPNDDRFLTTRIYRNLASPSTKAYH